MDEALNIAKQICEALEAAQEKGITHRDLKPGNIKIAPSGHVKLLDFGLAKIFDDPSQPQLSNSPTMMSRSMPGIILGTAAYMSPEQARGQAVDRLSDNWAFGCVLYEILTAKPAFTGDTVTDILGAVVRIDPEWAELPSATPRAIQRLLRRCLTKDKRRRLQSIGDARIEIEQVLNEPQIETASLPAATAPGQPRLAWGVALTAAMLFVVASVPAVLHVLETDPQQVQVRFEIPAPPTAASASFELSPDGRTLVYVAPMEGKSFLWVRPMDSVTAEPLTGTEEAYNPFWSPDSRSIGFFADGKLKRIDVGGGPARTLADASNNSRGGTWNHEGVIVFAPAANSGLFRIPASGGSSVPLTQLDSETAHRFPAFLPDDRHFIYQGQGGLDGNGIYVASLVSASVGGALAYRTGAPGGLRQFAWFDRSGKTLGVVGPVDLAITEVEIAPDGRRLAVVRFSDIWIVDIARGLFSRFTSEAGIERWPLWSPDGLRVAFEPIGSGQIHIKALDGT